MQSLYADIAELEANLERQREELHLSKEKVIYF
jgi:hypothetical protein